MANLLVLIACLVIGLLLKRFKKLPLSAPTVLNGFVIYVSLPALTLLRMHELTLTGSGIYFPIAMPWILFALASLFFVLLGRRMGWRRDVIGALILTGGLGNTSFVGFPLLEALYGSPALGTGILVDQPGTFLILSTVGIATASLYAARSLSVISLTRRLLAFPPFLALVSAIVLRCWTYPLAFSGFLEKLSSTLVPIALVSVGFQLDLRRTHLPRYGIPLLLGLGFKLVLAPALLAMLYVGALEAHGNSTQIILAEAAMAPMITAAIVASEYDLAPELANLMVSVGIPLSLITVPIWAHFLRSV